MTPPVKPRGEVVAAFRSRPPVFQPRTAVIPVPSDRLPNRQRLNLHAAAATGERSGRKSSAAPPEETRAPAASEPASLGRTLAITARLTHPPFVGSRPRLTNPRNGGCQDRLGRYLESLRERRVGPQPTPLG